MSKAKLPYKEFPWTFELAYAIGLIVTDGNLSKDCRHINLRSSDKELLKIFKNCLKLKNNAIAQTYNNGYAKKPTYRVQFGNVQFYRWLTKIGVKPAKTYTIGALKIPQKFFMDFLRGHLDGDGCIQNYCDTYNTYKNRRYVNTRVYTRFISASQQHIHWLYGMIKKCLDVKGAILLKKPKQQNRVPMWEIKFSKYDSLKLFRSMYYRKNLPSLIRKRKIAEELLKHVYNNKLIR